MYSKYPVAAKQFPHNRGAFLFQLRRKAKLRILYFQTHLCRDFELAVQAYKSKGRDSRKYNRPVFIKQPWKLEVAQKDAYEAVNDPRRLKQEELSHVLDRWLAIYLRFAVRKRQQLIGSKKAADCIPNKQVQWRFIVSELKDMNGEKPDGWEYWGHMTGINFWLWYLYEEKRFPSDSIAVQPVRWSSTPSLEK